MRNFTVSSSEPQWHQQRVNSNPKLQMMPEGKPKRYDHIQYEANTFSSQYSLSHYQPNRAVEDDMLEIQDEFLDSQAQNPGHNPN